jgi:hypothetical protein
MERGEGNTINKVSLLCGEMLREVACFCFFSCFFPSRARVVSGDARRFL